MSKKNLPKLNNAENVCDCAEEAERRKRNAGVQVMEQKGLLASAWLPILGISALVLGLFGLWYKKFSKKPCRKPASIGTGWDGAHNVVKADEDTSGLPICPCDIKLNPKKRKWPIADKK